MGWHLQGRGPRGERRESEILFRSPVELSSKVSAPAVR